MSEENDYARVERAIQFISRISPKQAALADVAEHVGLSEFHFQRLFARWAGISPKRFAQYLTIEHAKSMLRNSLNILDASYAIGMSGSGRLHDLFVTIEAATPGEYRSGGSGVDISYGMYDGPFGDMLVATTKRGICGIWFRKEDESAEALQTILMSQWPAANVKRDQAAGRELASRIFAAGDRDDGRPIPLLARGTNFQINVWKALLRIPAGSVVTYEQLASMSGQPQAVRATGTAVGRNPISWLIPCHRVIRKSGEFGNYGGGVERKKAMLAWESARHLQGEEVF